VPIDTPLGLRLLNVQPHPGAAAAAFLAAVLWLIAKSDTLLCAVLSITIAERAIARGI
jgi:hypothetical protein